jgi:hypothetical protein
VISLITCQARIIGPLFPDLAAKLDIVSSSYQHSVRPLPSRPSGPWKHIRKSKDNDCHRKETSGPACHHPSRGQWAGDHLSSMLLLRPALSRPNLVTSRLHCSRMPLRAKITNSAFLGQSRVDSALLSYGLHLTDALIDRFRRTTTITASR